MLVPARPNLPTTHSLRGTEVTHGAHGHGGSRDAQAGPAWAILADRILGYVTEIPAAILVVAEIVVLFAGVTSRYVFQQPIIWSDELASILFLWLAMLGAAAGRPPVALRARPGPIENGANRVIHGCI